MRGHYALSFENISVSTEDKVGQNYCVRGEGQDKADYRCDSFVKIREHIVTEV